MELIELLVVSALLGAEIVHPAMKPGLLKLLPSPLESPGANLRKQSRIHPALLETEQIIAIFKAQPGGCAMQSIPGPMNEISKFRQFDSLT